jgi:tetratricopeptide (TPR) repeat protein
MKPENVSLFPEVSAEDLGDVWQVRALLMPAWVDDEKRPPFRPIGALAVSTVRDLIGASKTSADEGSGHRQVEEALASLAKTTGSRPAVIEVRDPELAERLRRHRRWGACTIRLGSEQTHLDRAYEEMRRNLTTDEPVAPLTSGGVTVDAIRRFADAALEFWTAQPWRLFAPGDQVGIEATDVHPEIRSCVVAGADGQEFGVLAASVEALDLLGIEGDGPGGPLWLATFHDPWEVPVADHDLWLEHDLPRTENDLLPTLRRIGPGPDDVRTPSQEELHQFEALLKTLARTTEEETLRDSWKAEGQHGGGPFELRLTLSQIDEELVRDLREALLASWGLPDDDEEDADLGDRPGLLDDADTLTQVSFFTRGRLAARLAARALALDPDSARGHLAASTASADPNRAVDLVQRGIEIQKRKLGEQVLAEHRGTITRVDGGRTLLELCHERAVALARAGRYDEAESQDRELLALDEGDRYGARHLLPAHLMAAGRSDEALAWIEAELTDEPSTDTLFLKALATFLDIGDEAAGRLLDEAMEGNPAVGPMLVGIEPLPGESPALYEPGSPEEAVLFVQKFGWLWSMHPQSLGWVATGFVRHGRRRHAASRPRSRKRKAPPLGGCRA